MFNYGVDIVLGPPVTGENLYGRDGELDTLWDRIRNNSILLLSPRRFGKTSLVREMERNPRDGFAVVYMDVEGAGSPGDLVEGLAGKIEQSYPRRILKALMGVRESIEEVKIQDAAVKLRESRIAWKSKGGAVFDALKDPSTTHIVVLDELPLFLLALEKKGGDLGEFMLWLRSVRQNSGIRFILCGSIGMGTVLNRHGLGYSINDLERVKVGPFDGQTARGMIKTILDRYGVPYEQDHVGKILKKVGAPVPYFLQLMLHNIVHGADVRAPLTDDVITGSYENIVLTHHGREYFGPYYDRLGVEFPSEPLHSAVMEVLDLVATRERCQEPDLRTAFLNRVEYDADAQFRNAMNTLEDGFYIVRNAHYEFTSKVLRDWWMRERGLV